MHNQSSTAQQIMANNTLPLTSSKELSSSIATGKPSIQATPQHGGLQKPPQTPATLTANNTLPANPSMVSHHGCHKQLKYEESPSAALMANQTCDLVSFKYAYEIKIHMKITLLNLFHS